MILWKCCTQYASQFGKLSSGHRSGKGQFSLQSQRKTMPKNVQTNKWYAERNQHLWKVLHSGEMGWAVVRESSSKEMMSMLSLKKGVGTGLIEVWGRQLRQINLSQGPEVSERKRALFIWKTAGIGQITTQVCGLRNLSLPCSVFLKRRRRSEKEQATTTEICPKPEAMISW